MRLVNLATGEAWDGAMPEDRLALAQVARGLLAPGLALVGQLAGDARGSSRSAKDARGRRTDSVREIETSGRSLSIFAQAAGLLGTLESLLVQLDGVEGRKALVLVSPGFPQLMDLDKRLEQVATLARLAATTIYFVDAVGLDGLLPAPGGRMLPAFEMAWNRSGGARTWPRPPAASPTASPTRCCPPWSAWAGEMRTYYVVGYVPPKPDDGRFRSVRVKVSVRDATARTKKGYLAGQPRGARGSK